MTVTTLINGRWVPLDDAGEPVGVCRVCGEPNYLVDVSGIPHVEKLGRKNGIEKWGGIPVDHCIGPEVERLIRAGVVTQGCCCGHGQYPPSCIIAEESVNLAKELGYNPMYVEPGRWEIRLKTAPPEKEGMR